MDGPASNDDDSYMQLRRIRTGVEGKLARHYQHKIEYDFGRGSAVLTDGFLGLTHFEAANLRMGRYKVPFSSEELTSSNSIRFVERSMINRFAPSRMIGASLLGKAGGDISFWGTPLSFVGEFVMGDQDVVLDETSKKLSHTGVMVQACYVLTGDGAMNYARDNSVKSAIQPRRNLRCRPGA